MAQLHMQCTDLSTQLIQRRRLLIARVVTVVLIIAACAASLMLYGGMDLNPFHFRNTWTLLLGNMGAWLEFGQMEYSSNLLVLVLQAVWNFNMFIVCALLYCVLWAGMSVLQFILHCLGPLLLALVASAAIYMVIYRPHTQHHIFDSLDTLAKLLPKLAESLPDSCHIILRNGLGPYDDRIFEPLILVGPGGAALVSLYSGKVSGVWGSCFDENLCFARPRSRRLWYWLNPLPGAAEAAGKLSRFLRNQDVYDRVTAFQLFDCDAEALHITDLPVYEPTDEDVLPDAPDSLPILLTPDTLSRLTMPLSCAGELSEEQIPRIVQTIVNAQ